MRVRINGKEVEVGSSQDIRKKGDLREPLKQDKQFPKLRILGREIDMNNPDDVQWAIRSYRIQGMIFMLIGLSIFLFSYFSNLHEEKPWDIFIHCGLYAILFVMIGACFYFRMPKILNRRLKILRNQAKQPKKYHY